MVRADSCAELGRYLDVPNDLRAAFVRERWAPPVHGARRRCAGAVRGLWRDSRTGQGDGEAFASCPSADLNDADLGRLALDAPPPGADRHVGVDLPADVAGALASANVPCAWRWALNGYGDFPLEAMGFEG